jgi:TolB-like protein/Tfp pilus assembly protein PilF
VVYVYPKIFKVDTLEKLRASRDKTSIAVMPFQNMTSDSTFNYWQVSIQANLISYLSNTSELRVRQQDNINTLLQTNGTNELASISPSTAGTVSKRLEADFFINGNIQKAGSRIRISAQLIDTKTIEVLKSFEVNGPYNDSIIITISDSLRKKVTDFLLISKLIKENLEVQHLAASTNSPEALKNYVYGYNANKKWDFPTAREFYLKALEIDSNYLDPMMMLFDCDQAMGLMEQSLQLLLQMHRKRDQWPPVQQLWADWSYATSFESPDEQIKYLRQLQQIDDKRVDLPLIIGGDYNTKKEYNKAIPELEMGLELWQKTGWREYFKGNSAVYVLLGEAYHNTGQYEKEKKLYKIAEPDCPNDLPLILRQTSLSIAEKDSNSTNQYIEKFKSVCKANSSSPEWAVQDGLGDIYNLAGMKEKADSYYRKALTLTQNPRYMKGIATYYIENNRNLNDVQELMDKAMKLAANKVDYYDYLDIKGWGLYKQGKNKDALEILQKCWNEAPFKVYSIKSHYEEVKKAVGNQN